MIKVSTLRLKRTQTKTILVTILVILFNLFIMFIHFRNSNSKLYKYYARQSMITRTISEDILDIANKMPVITITEPRQSGKTTLAKSLFPKYAG